jgi:hypothetical protein
MGSTIGSGSGAALPGGGAASRVGGGCNVGSGTASPLPLASVRARDGGGGGGGVDARAGRRGSGKIAVDPVSRGARMLGIGFATSCAADAAPIAGGRGVGSRRAGMAGSFRWQRAH